MRRFKFSLETVLKVRRGTEEKLQREFGEVLGRRAKALAQLEALGSQLKSLNAWASRKLSGAVKVDRFEISQFEASRKACGEKISWQKEQLAEIEIELEAKRLALVEASRETKVIEKLEEAQYAAYLEKLNREEQAFMDELAQFSARTETEPRTQNSAA